MLVPRVLLHVNTCFCCVYVSCVFGVLRPEHIHAILLGGAGYLGAGDVVLRWLMRMCRVNT